MPRMSLVREDSVSTRANSRFWYTWIDVPNKAEYFGRFKSERSSTTDGAA